MRPKRIYLAHPYSYNPKEAFAVACERASILMTQGYHVFSPIAHTHCIADYLPEELRTDSMFWIPFDHSFIEWADEVQVLLIGEIGYDLVRKSIGVQDEIRYAKGIGRPIKYVQI